MEEEIDRSLFRRSDTNTTYFHNHRLDIGLGCIYIVFSLIGACINALAVCVFIQMFRKRRHGNNILQGALAFLDLCNCTLSLPYTSYGLLSGRNPEIQGYWKDISGFVFNTVSRATILIMGLIAGYRMAFIYSPITVSSSVRSKNMIIACVTITVICLVVSCVPLIWGDGYTWMPSVGFSGWQIEALTTNIQLHRALSSIFILVLVINPALITLIISIASVILLRRVSGKMVSGRCHQDKKTNSHKALTSLKYMLCSYAICYSGWITLFTNYYVIVIFGGKYNILLPFTRMTTVYIFTVSLLLVNANALINPLLTLCRGEELKKIVNSVFRKKKKTEYGPPDRVKTTVMETETRMVVWRPSGAIVVTRMHQPQRIQPIVIKQHVHVRECVMMAP